MSTKYLDDIYYSNVGLCMNFTLDFEMNFGIILRLILIEFYLVSDKLNVVEIEFNINKF